MVGFTDIVALGIWKWNRAFIRRQIWVSSTRGTWTRRKLRRLNAQITGVWGVLGGGWFHSALYCRLTNDFNLWLRTPRVRKKSCFPMVAIDGWERRGRRWETTKFCQESRDLGEFKPCSVVFVGATGPLTTNTSRSPSLAGQTGDNDMGYARDTRGTESGRATEAATSKNQIPTLFHFVPFSLFLALSPLPGPHLDLISMDLR